jgi:hypothetical protein
VRRPLGALLALLTAAGLLIAPPAAADPSSKFATMFPSLPGFTAPTNQQLADLAGSMLDPNADSENNVGTDSIFTYFGQFLDHDLTLDDTPSPTSPVNVATLPRDVRTLRFDLDSVYGDGPDGSPQLYAADHEHFLVQRPNANGVVDLPRRADGSAILVEGRNDENEIISQIHTAFLLSHNRLIDSGMPFASARQRLTLLYQHIILDEFLPHTVGQAVVDGTRDGTLKRFYKPANPNAAKVPVEFSVAAYRFGHSQVRRAYELTNATGKVQVFSATAPDLRGGRPLPAGRQIDWGNFVAELTRPENVPHVNVSRKIDTLISSSLFVLPIPGTEATGSNVLAFRNLVRADAYGMASGQDVARAMGIPVIPPEEVTRVLGFETGTPLWFYVLAESSRDVGGKTLGPTGGRIVADVFYRTLQDDPNGILAPGAQPATFSLAELFVFAGLATR